MGIRKTKTNSGRRVGEGNVRREGECIAIEKSEERDAGR
jgi:hypothetical protein